MSKFCKEVDLKPLELIKEYNKRYPEKSAKEQMSNLKKALDVCDCEKPSTDNTDLWFCTNCMKPLRTKSSNISKNNDNLGIGVVSGSATIDTKYTSRNTKESN